MTRPYSHLLLASQQFHRLCNHQYAAFMARTGLAMREISILLSLSEAPEADTARDITLLWGFVKSQVSQGVENLASAGFLQRTPDQHDHRVIHLSLSERALPLVQECQMIQEETTRHLLKGLTPEQLTAFYEMMGTVHRNWDQMMQEAAK